MGLKVAVIGLAQSQSEAPWADPEWEKWGLAWDANWPQFQRTFEMHEPAEIKARMPAAYFDELQHRTRLYMPAQYVPGCIAYPFEAVAASVGDYWISSIAYMVSLAIHEGAEEIGLFGVDMDIGSEYEYQRANAEYLIGFARGRGIKVRIPDASPLLKFVSPSDCDYTGRYGRLK